MKSCCVVLVTAGDNLDLILLCFVLKERLNYTFGPRVLTYSRNLSYFFKTEQSCPSIIIFVALLVLTLILSSKNVEVSSFLMMCPK